MGFIWDLSDLYGIYLIYMGFIWFILDLLMINLLMVMEHSMDTQWLNGISLGFYGDSICTWFIPGKLMVFYGDLQ